MPKLLKERILPLESLNECLLSLKYVWLPLTAILYLNRGDRVFLTDDTCMQSQSYVHTVKPYVCRHAYVYA